MLRTAPSRLFLAFLFVASLLLVGCGGEHYHGPKLAYEGVFNTSTETGGDKQVTLRLFDDGTYLTRTIYNNQSFVPVVEAGTWDLDGEALLLTAERIDGEPTLHATTTFAVNADDLEAVSINGSPVDYVWAYTDGAKLSERALEAPKAHHDEEHGDDHDAEHSDEAHDGDHAADTDHSDEAAPTVNV
ncbi:MAG: hypothetical protein AAF809_11250 [Bacteroidota bacterium]